MNTQPEPIPELLAASNVSPASKAALTTPHEFLKRQDDKHKERRQFKSEAERHSAFTPFLEIAA